jgi:arylsulfatase
MSWPDRIKNKGGLRQQFVHTIDIVPTLYELCGITAPTELNGIQQKPIEGISFAFTIDDDEAESKRRTQYFELGGNRGLYHDGWMASAVSFVPWEPNRGEWDPDKATWELYKVDEDFSQSNDVAAKYPEKLRELQDLWWVEAAKYNVLPLDWRAGIRMNAEAMGRPSLARGRTSIDYYEGMVGLPNACSPEMLNKSWSITARVDLPDDKCEGMIITHGGSEGGYGLYLRDGRPTFVYNFLALERPTFASETRLDKGKHTIVVNFDYDGGGMGKGGTITVKADGKKVAGGRLERTVPIQFAIFEGLDIGMDSGSPVDFTYKLPFKFTGKIEKVTVELKALTGTPGDSGQKSKAATGRK